jgi:GNAT superfamily N-acetyltransferase
MTITPATETDLTAITAYDRHIPRERLLGCIQRGLVTVLRSEDRILGVLRWNLFWQSIPFLDLIYLDEAVRGQRWGTRMMAHWEEAMRCGGFDQVMLSTQADETSKFFYEKLGYRQIGAFLPPDQDAQELIYLKELTP